METPYTHDELIAAFKGDRRDELGAIEKYSGQLPRVADPEMRRKLEEIRDEEQTHATEFGEMLDGLDAPYDPSVFDARLDEMDHYHVVAPTTTGGEIPIREEPDGTYGEAPPETQALAEDHSEVAHWISGLGGSPGIVADPGKARSQPCIRYELGAGHKPLVFQKGISGPLDEEQAAEFCAMGYEDKQPTERQRRRFRALPEAAHTCSQEVREVPKDRHIDAYYSCLERELRNKGVQ